MALWKKSFTTAAAVAAACTVGALLTGFVPADAETVNAADAVAAIQQVAPEAVADSAGTTAGTDSKTAATMETPAGSASVPTDAADGIQFGGGDALALTIGLPFAERASDATESRLAGVFVYNNNNGSSTVPVIRDGGVQISTVIDNANAPKRYDYTITVPDGQTLQLAPDGSAFVGIEDGGSVTMSAAIAKPWAKDAKGNEIPTHYEIDGNTLTQVIDFTEATTFPVVADPSVTFGTYIVVTMSQATAQAINAGSVGTAIAILALTGPIGGIIAAAVYSTVGGHNATKLSQCRNWAFSYTYLGQLVKAGCA